MKTETRIEPIASNRVIVTLTFEPSEVAILHQQLEDTDGEDKVEEVLAALYIALEGGLRAGVEE